MLEEFLTDINELPLNWCYFSDFSKLSTLEAYREECLTLNGLIGLGKREIIHELNYLINELPNIEILLYLMIALRKESLTKLKIKQQNKDTSIKDYENLVCFLEDSGVLDLLSNSVITDVYSYLSGILIGLDTNARKNRAGKMMELACKEEVQSFCEQNKLIFYEQKSLADLIPGVVLSKRFDFIIESSNKFLLIEVNNYNSNGSKLKSISEEYTLLLDNLPKNKVEFIWVTNGNGWINNKKIAIQNLINFNHFITYNQLVNGYLNKFIHE